MQFQSSFITQAGSNLFASATSSTNGNPSTPIVWVYARTYNLDTSGYTADQMRALDVTALTTGSGNKQTSVGNITSAEPCDATDSSSGTPVQIPTVRLTCTLSNEGTYYGPARNLAVFAKLKGQADTSAVLVAIARVDSGHPVDEIPRKADADFSATIDFVLAIKDSQINTIQAPASYYASAQTVQNLADRVVTTHLANNTTTGEPQDIYGVKTFKNNTKHTGDILPTVNNTYSLGNTTLGWKNIYAAGNNSHYICIGYDSNLNTNSKLSISPDQNGFGQLGTSDKHWSKIYAENYYVGNTALSSYIAGTTVTNATTATNLEDSPELTWTTASDSSTGGTLKVKAGGKNSNSITIDKVQKAYSPYIAAVNNNANYYIVLGGSISAGSTFSTDFKNLHADSVNSLYYNPSTNKLTCPVFSGNTIIQYIAECTTAKGTAAKTATIADFTLTAGTRVFIKFTNGNSASSPTLNISSKGAKSINHIRIGLPENSIVPLIYNGDSWDVEGSFSTVASVDIRGNNNNTAYPVIFAGSFATDTDVYARKSLYTDSSSTDALRYNPSTNTLIVKNIELGETGIINLAAYFGISLQIIDIYCSGVVNPGNSFTFSSGNTVKTGTGAYGHGGSSNHSNYTVCVHGSNNILYSTTYKITKMISAGQNSYNQTQNYNGVEIAKPGYGTPCICFATVVS